MKTINNEIYAFGRNKFAHLGIQSEEKELTIPIKVLPGKEDIWRSNRKSRAKISKKIK